MGSPRSRWFQRQAKNLPGLSSRWVSARALPRSQALKEEPKVTICEEMMYISADKNAIFRVIENILSNALRHGTGGYEVELLKEEETCVIKISNLTDSIEETDVVRIFERFYTTDKSRTKKGTGLGLAIAKKFSELLGGTFVAKLVDNKFMILLAFKVTS